MVGIPTQAMRRVALLVTAGMIATGCSGSNADTTTTTAPPTTSTTTSSTTSTTTTSTTTTTTTTQPPTTTMDPLARPEVLVSNPNRDSIDDFDTTGDDLYRIVVEIFDLFSYLEANPSDSALDMVTLIAAPDYPFYEVMLEGFFELEENPGWHYVDPGIEIVAVEITETDDARAVARVVNRRDEQQLADATGAVVKTYPGSALSVNEFVLERGIDGRWRLSEVGPSLPISQEESHAMVPVSWEGRGS